MTPAERAFLAGLPTGENGQLKPGHTTWNMLGPKAKARWERIVEAVSND